MTKVKAIAPLRLSEPEMARRQLRYQRLAGGYLSVDLVNLPEGAPDRLDTPEEIARSGVLVCEEIRRTEPGQFDVILPDCVLDPGVGDVPDAPAPVVGLLRLVAGFLHGTGRHFAAVVRNQAIADELTRRLVSYEMASACVAVEVLDVDFCLIADGRGWSAAMTSGIDRLRNAGVSVVFNGCSAVDVDTHDLGTVAVVDPVRLALRLLAVAAGDGVLRSAGLPDLKAESQRR